MLLWTLASAHAAVLFGGAWTPVGVGALAWDDAGQFTGTLAGEFDGLLRPPFTAHGGWIGARDAVLANLSVVQLTTSRFSSSNAVTTAGGVRVGADWRRYLWAREPGVNLYGDVGAFGVIPIALDMDGAYTEAEQADADEGASATMARIGGFGGQGGIGAEYLIADPKGRPAVAVGVRWLFRGYRGQDADEDAVRVSTLFGTEAALVLEFMR
jgi:hypothetical protein